MDCQEAWWLTAWTQESHCLGWNQPLPLTPSGASYLTSLCLYVLICELEMTQATHRAILRVDGNLREMLRGLYLEGDPQIAMETIHCRYVDLAYPG